jgi:hypothetical protein
MTVKIQHLRSETANKRPLNTSLLSGEVALNTDSGTPGLFFKNTLGQIVKVGPIEVGSSAPNITPASGGSSGNSTGEMWLDTSNSGGNSLRVLKVYDGTAWRNPGSVTVGTTSVEVGGTGTTTISGLTDLSSGTLNVSSTVNLNNQSKIKFFELTTNGTNYVGFKAPPSISSDLTWTLPGLDGTHGQFLKTNGSGVLSWETVETDNIGKGDSYVKVTDNGTNGNIVFGTENADRWVVNSSGHFIPGTDSTYNIGAVGTEILNVYSDNLYGTLQTSSQTNITGVGTLTTGTWQATTIDPLYGGTGFTSYTNGQLLIGNTNTGKFSKATLTAGNGITVTNGEGTITLAVAGKIPDQFLTDSGTATSTNNIYNVVGAIGGGISTAATTNNISIALTITGVTAASYGSASQVATFTVDSKGRLTSAASQNISITASQVTDFDTQVRTNRLDQLAVPTTSVSLNNQLITNLATPLADTDAANKGYVDSVAQGLDVKGSCRVATTGGITLSGLQTIDGIAVLVGNRVLVKNQNTQAENGIYVASESTWTRSTDLNQGVEFPGAFTFIEEGTTHANSGWVCATDDPVVVGTTAIVFEQFSGAGQITAGSGLSKTGNTLDVNVDNTTLEISSDSLRIKTTYVGQTSLTTLGTITTGTWNGTILGLSYGGTGVDNTNITSKYALMGPNASNGNASFREILTSDIAPITGGSFDAGTY